MNWGTKIVLGMIAFMLFIIAMVVYMFSVHGNDALVDEDYYEKGINYNQEYTARQNMIDEQAAPLITIDESQIIMELKDSVSYELKLMRPTSAKEDVKVKGQTIGDSHLILVNRRQMHKGLWFLELKWTKHKKNYLFKKELTL